MQAEPKKRGRKSAADKAAEAAIAAPVESATVEQAPEVQIAPVFAPEPVSEAPALPLKDYIKAKERDVPPLVQITHPDAADGGFHAGVYSGIRLKKGPCQALYSDGTAE